MRDVRVELCSRCRSGAAPLKRARRSGKPVCVNAHACRRRCLRNDLVRRRAL